MKVKIPFNVIQINLTKEKTLEVVFFHGGKFYAMPWNEVPEKFKILHVAKLKLLGCSIPDFLKSYIKDVVDLSDVNIEMDLSKCKVV